MGLIGNIKTGSPGAQGIQGNQGPPSTAPGPAGDDADDYGFPIPGNQGTTGPQGIIGPVGPQAPVGPSGDDGDDAWTVIAGPTGPPGPPGTTGSMGTNIIIPGPPGDDGDDGWMGAPGAAGATGAAGSGSSYGNEATYTVPPTATSGYGSSITSASGGGDTWAAATNGNSQSLSYGSASANTSSTISGVFKLIPNSGAGLNNNGFSLTCRFIMWQPPSGSGSEASGLVLTDGTKYYQFGLGTVEADGITLGKITRATSSSAPTGTHLLAFNGTSNQWAGIHYWLRYRDDTTNRKLDFSWNGNTWLNLLSEARTTFLTATSIGWGGNKNGVAFSITAAWYMLECVSFSYVDV